MIDRLLSVAALVAITLAGGCAAGLPPGHERWVHTELMFGMSKPKGGGVSAVEWQQFLDREVAKRFPNGFTVLDSAGEWRNATGESVREASHVVVLLHPTTQKWEQDIEAVRALYKKQFEQEAVLRADTIADVSF